MNDKQTILIVDDTPENIDVLRGLIKREYKIKVALNGGDALKIVESGNLPDIILLDIMMPEIDGYEVCRRLKENDKTKDIPVIFITAKGEDEDEKLGLDIGAVDYITKPFNPAIVLARVKTHLSLAFAIKKLEEQNKELIEAAKLREDVERIMRHDLKTPLNGIIGMTQLLSWTGEISNEQKEYIKIIEEEGYSMLNMINLSLDLFKMERGIYTIHPSPVNIIKVVNKILNDVNDIVSSKTLTVEILLDGKPADKEGSFIISGEELLCYSMLANLIYNAVEASPQGERISIHLTHNERNVISIRNKGTVPVEIRENFFEKYVTMGKHSGTGLGTYSARLIADTHGGAINLDTSEPDATTINITLPIPLT